MKCCKCKKPCEEVWMFGFIEDQKDKEYCLECFTPLSLKILPQVTPDIPPVVIEQNTNP